MVEKGNISVREAGRKGGLATSKTHGHEFYEAMLSREIYEAYLAKVGNIDVSNTCGRRAAQARTGLISALPGNDRGAMSLPWSSTRIPWIQTLSIPSGRISGLR